MPAQDRYFNPIGATPDIEPVICGIPRSRVPARVAISPRPCIRPSIKSLVSLDFLDFLAAEPRASIVVANSPLCNPLSPCVTASPGSLATPGIAAAPLSRPCPGPSVSEPADPETTYRAIWRDGSRSRASRLQCDPPAI